LKYPTLKSKLTKCAKRFWIILEGV
jgi:hypothetical protein